MAYTAGNLVQMATGNGYSFYRYDTTDAISAVDDIGYFNNSDDDLNLKKGDIIHIIVWDTVRTGLPTDYGICVVGGIDANGDVNLSDDQLAGSYATGA